jgi:methylated-DNA-[protein]-cysteine S-methyltransferase
MGQRLVTRPKRRATSRPEGLVHEVQPASLSIFDTEMGWFGLVGSGDVVVRVFIGHASADQVRSAAARMFQAAGGKTTADGEELTESDWNPKLRRKFQDFARGIPTDFGDVKLNLGRITPFRKRVIEAARRIGYGRTLAYGELAANAGSPGAARAIGTVMATNLFPIIVPCHRVVASGGAIGGFSAPHGIELKRRLLNMEAAAR